MFLNFELDDHWVVANTKKNWALCDYQLCNQTIAGISTNSMKKCVFLYSHVPVFCWMTAHILKYFFQQNLQ